MSTTAKGKPYKERILDYLWSVSPEWATNGQIREATGIPSHQQVYLLTQRLAGTGLIRGQQRGREWVFRADESLAAQFISPGRALAQERSSGSEGQLSPHAFESLARKVMSKYLDVHLAPGQVPGVPKEWDMVSPDRNIVGDARYFALVRGQHLPPAKFSVISEYVWLLEKTGALTIFLVFGNDRQVPDLWLQRYGFLAIGVDFYFLSEDGKLQLLDRND